MVVAGTRPEAIKLSPLVKWLKRLKVDFVFVWSGQHYDYELSQVFFEQLGLPKPDANLGIRSGSNCLQTAKGLVRLEKAITSLRPSIVIAEGDTNTVCATALASIKSEIPFGHVEAGLRSFDRTMPEEINRTVSDSCSELLFAPTEIAVMNLVHEGIPLRKIRLTGNTIVDVVEENKRFSEKAACHLMEELNVKPMGYLLVTFHRRENVGIPDRLLDFVNAVRLLGKKFKVIFPVHPYTRMNLKKSGVLKKLEEVNGVSLIPPIGYFEFLGLLLNSMAVLTDSGGVQEEALTLGVPTITMRHNTERPETVALGVNVLVGTNPDNICKATELQIRRRQEIRDVLSRVPNPIGDGKASERISREIKCAIETGIEIESSDTRDDPCMAYSILDPKLLFQKINISAEIFALYDHNGISNGAFAGPNFDNSLEKRILESEKVLVRVSRRVLTDLNMNLKQKSGE